MTSFDYVAVSVVLISLLLGVWRGFVYEVLSLAGWPLAFVFSRMFAADVEPMLPVMQAEMRSVAAYVLVFVAALLVWGLLTWLVSRLVKAAGLGVLDSLLGALFGVLRGALVVLVAVWLAGLTSLPEQPLWRDAKFSRQAEDVALLARVWLPDQIAQRMHYRDRG